MLCLRSMILLGLVPRSRCIFNFFFVSIPFLHIVLPFFTVHNQLENNSSFHMIFFLIFPFYFRF